MLCGIVYPLERNSVTFFISVGDIIIKMFVIFSEEAVNQSYDRIEAGIYAPADPFDSWRYEITREDIFAIPVIKFNIDTDYKRIQKQKFITKDNVSHEVVAAYQRTGFILNENGAVVESEAVAVADSSAAVVALPKPKKMIFDKPFLIIVKRVDQKNPYFVMKVNNAELLVHKKSGHN